MESGTGGQLKNKKEKKKNRNQLHCWGLCGGWRARLGDLEVAGTKTSFPAMANVRSASTAPAARFPGKQFSRR